MVDVNVLNGHQGSVDGAVVMAGTINGGIHLRKGDGADSAGPEQRHRIGVEIRQVVGGTQVRYRFENAADRVVVVPAAEVADALHHVRALHRDAANAAPRARAAMLVNCGARLHALLDTAERVLSEYRERTRGAWPTLLLAIDAEEEIARLPWELLHDGEVFLVAAPDPVIPVRVVASGGRPRPAAKRGLRLLFMACAPLGGLPGLDYDAEHDAIISLARTHSLEPHFDDSGSLVDLENRLGEYECHHFDVIHLDGHVEFVRGEAVLATEGVRGERVDADATALREAVRASGPSVLFLSGRSMSDEADGFPTGSLAARLVGTCVPVVIGWDRRRSDARASKAVTAFYQVLARGRTLVEALATTYRAMLIDGGSDWHCLRVFVAGEPSGALVTAPRAGGARLARVLPGPGDEGRSAEGTGFVGRRRELQDAVRLLGVTGAPDPVGLVLCGMGGLGKTRLARRVQQRLTADYEVVRVEGDLTKRKLVDAIAADIERDVHLQQVDAALPLVDRLTRFLRGWAMSRVKLLLFELDAFEHSFEVEPGGTRAITLTAGRPTTTPEAAMVLTALVTAVRNCGYGPYRIIMTTRYPPDLPCTRHLKVTRLGALSRLDLERVVARRVGGLAALSADRVDAVISIAGGNTRLTEWLVSTALRETRIEPDALRAVLRDNRMDFLEQDVFAPMLLSRIGVGDARVLEAASPFRIPVPVDVLTRLTGDDAREVVWRLTDLGLLEHRAGEVDRFVLPGVLRSRHASDDDPEALRARYAACARELAACSARTVAVEDLTEVDVAALLEVHRLSQLGASLVLEVESAVALADHLLFRQRFTEARHLCMATLARLHEHGREHHALYLIMGQVQLELGEPQSTVFLDRALEECPQEAGADRAEILATRGFWSTGHSPEHALSDLRTAVDLAREHEAPIVLAFALRCRARALDAARPPGWTAEVPALIAEALDLVPSDGLHHAAVLVDRAIAQHLPNGAVADALKDLDTALAIEEAKGSSAHQAITLLAMANAALVRGRADLAVRWADDAASRSAVPRVKTGLHLLRGGIAYLAGDLVHARFHFKVVREKAREIGHLGHQLDALDGLLRVFAGMGDREEADRIRRAQKRLVNELKDPTALISALLDPRELDSVGVRTRVERASEAAAIAAAVHLPDRELRAWQVYFDHCAGAEVPETDLEGPLRRMLELLGASGGGGAPYAKRLGVLLLRAERFAEARQALMTALGHYEQHGFRENAAEVRECLSEAARGAGRADEAEHHLWVAASQRLQVGACAAAARTLRAIAALRPDHAGEVLLLARRLTRIAPSGLDEEQVLLDMATTEEGAREEAVRARARAQPLLIAVAPDLAPCVDPARGGRFLAAVEAVRGDVRAETGWTVPEVLVTQALDLPTARFVINLWGEPVVEGVADEALLGDRVGAVVVALRAAVADHRALLSAPEPAPAFNPEVDALSAAEVLALLREQASAGEGT
ncbi:AAA ATPase domain-containing protein [Actinosynnema pretiosum]|nr:AAA ATPase domain-containing protein [Actinosynnema pretiosum]